MTFQHTPRPHKAIVMAVLDSAIDDIGHTDNMVGRVLQELFGYDSDNYIRDSEMIDACEWAKKVIAKEPDE